jgi:hypothetical protein
MRLPEIIALFLPDWAALPLLIGLGIAVIVGFVSPRRAGKLILVGIGLYVLAPFVEAVFLALPWWFGALVFLWAAITFVRGVLTALVGREAAGHALGAFVVWSVASSVRVCFALARLVVRSVASRRT